MTLMVLEENAIKEDAPILAFMRSVELLYYQGAPIKGELGLQDMRRRCSITILRHEIRMLYC